ncbi:unnamed protein product, partial [Allacma fusca]
GPDHVYLIVIARHPNKPLRRIGFANWNNWKLAKGSFNFHICTQISKAISNTVNIKAHPYNALC